MHKIVIYVRIHQMSTQSSEFNPHQPERMRGIEENPRVTTMLGSAGLTAIDMQFFDRLYQQEQSVFIHGSIIANRITPRSDIDFTIIGKLDDMSPELRDTLMPGLIAIQGLHAIDYISTSIQSQNGRKISMHISEPDFRETYPSIDKPFATEFRPGRHAKVGDRKYFLPGVNRDGHIRLVNFLCQSESVGTDGSTITDVPQTGRVRLRGKDVAMDNSPKAGFTADTVIGIRTDGEDDSDYIHDGEEIMILGLEFDKMQSDTSMYNDPEAEKRFVAGPAVRSMEAVGEFTQTDPNTVTNRMFGELAKYWPRVKPHKSR